MYRRQLQQKKTLESIHLREETIQEEFELIVKQYYITLQYVCVFNETSNVLKNTEKYEQKQRGQKAHTRHKKYHGRRVPGGA